MLDSSFAAVVDPRMKLEYFTRRTFPDNVITWVEERSKDAYHRYKGTFFQQNRGVRTRTESSSEEASVSLKLLSDDEFSVASVIEVELYLSTKRDGRYKSVIEFYHAKKGTYHVLFDMAKDYLAIPAMSAPSESLFSRMNDVLTRKCSDGGAESDESDESDEEIGGEMDGDTCDATRTSKGRNPAAVEIVIQVDKLSQD